MDLNIDSQNLLSSGAASKALALARQKHQPASDKERAAAKKAAQEFEALFVGMMLKSMRGTVGKDELTGGGQGEEIYRSLLDQEYAAAAAQRGGLGLARIIERELVRQSGATGKVFPDPDRQRAGLSTGVESREGIHED